MSKVKLFLIVLIMVLIGLTGLIDTSPDYSAQEIDERYGTTN